MRRPNIVWVLTDDQGMGDLGCTGNPWVITPNIDAFYDNSTHMTNYHVGPTCAPTRSTLMTGHYANSTGVWHTVGGRSLLRENEWTLPTALSEDGYKTGIFGKWHLGDTYPYRACDRGFQTSVTHGGGGISQLPDHWGNDYFDDTYSVDGVPQKFTGYCTDVFFDEGMKFIEENKDEPFFCYITCNAPHTPLNVPQKYLDMYSDVTDISEHRKRFYAMITNIDENFGKMINHLETLNILEDTIVIFMTDNGTASGITRNAMSFAIEGYNWGLRGGKGSEYDGGHRVPFFIRYDADNQNKGRDISTLTASIDIMPTLLDYCDVKAGLHTFHGTSLVPLLHYKDLRERTIVTDSQRVTTPQKWRKSAVMTNRWRLVNGVELYDMHEDKEQRNDVAAHYPKVVKELREEYNDWWAIVSEQFDDEVPIHIGKNEAVITAHDLRNPESNTAWHQAHVREGITCSGYWEILVKRTGKYRFELRRWSRDYPRAIRSDIDINNNDIEFTAECIEPQEYKYYQGGHALDIVKAELSIAGHSVEAEVSDSDEFIAFELDLEKGATYLKSHFIDSANRVYAPYFVYITKI